MRRRARPAFVFVCASLAWVAVTPGALAQRANALGLTRLPANTRIRIHLTDSTMLAGRLARASEDTLHLERTVGRSLFTEIRSDTLVSILSVDRVWRHMGNDWQRGAIIGGAAGGLLGIALGNAASDAEDAQAAVPVLGFFGLATGAFFGALIGRTIDRWTLVGSSRL